MDRGTNALVDWHDLMACPLIKPDCLAAFNLPPLSHTHACAKPCQPSQHSIGFDKLKTVLPILQASVDSSKCGYRRLGKSGWGTDYIDLLQIHRFDHSMPIEETMKALHYLVQSGLDALHWRVRRPCRPPSLSRCRTQYNLLYREEEREMSRFCRATGISLVPLGPAVPRPTSPAAPRPSGSAKRSRQEQAMQPGSIGTAEPDLAVIVHVVETADKHA